MALFVIAVAAVAAAILWLWVKQRRERGTVDTIDGFRSSLEKLSTPTAAEREFFADASDGADDRTPDHDARPTSVQRHDGAETSPRAPLGPLTPERRAAARERIAQRRRAMRSSATR